MSLIHHYAVMGNPITHSKSPLIHHTFAQQIGTVLKYHIDYSTILVGTQTGDFEKAVQIFLENGGKGLNITVPFKQEAWKLATQQSERAKRAGAVNTLWFKEEWIGDNTDGVGFIRDLSQNHGCAFQGKRVLILGAGGAVRGILQPLLAEKPIHCVIANRTVSKAEQLSHLFADMGNITASSYEALEGSSYDVIINGTSASLQGELPPLADNLLHATGCCYDMMYSHTDTPFIQWAKQQGCVLAIDGLGMLVEQAAESFYLWHGVKPNTVPVIQQIREQHL
ncbi:MAG: shikimate dehydrogenase [Thiomargarita sp.]|nr:shikimate dehydrogenase [Thiomargarita sp.]